MTPSERPRMRIILQEIGLDFSQVNAMKEKNQEDHFSNLGYSKCDPTAPTKALVPVDGSQIVSVEGTDTMIDILLGCLADVTPSLYFYFNFSVCLEFFKVKK